MVGAGWARVCLPVATLLATVFDCKTGLNPLNVGEVRIGDVLAFSVAR